MGVLLSRGLNIEVTEASRRRIRRRDAVGTPSPFDAKPEGRAVFLR